MAEEVTSLRSLLDALRQHFDADPGVEDVATIEAAEKALGVLLPANYKGFLFTANGGETLDPLPRFRFYPVEELAPRRADGQPSDIVEFGTDDGDGFGFDTRRGKSTADYPVVRYELGDTGREGVEDVAPSFDQFLAVLLRGGI